MLKEDKMYRTNQKRSTGYPMTIIQDEEKISIRDAKRDETIAVISSDMQRMKSDMGLVMTNHLPHINKAIDGLEKKVDDNHERVMTKVGELQVSIAKWSGGAVAIIGTIEFILKFVVGK